MQEVLNVLTRWLHISSAVTLIGGLIYGRFVLVPGLAVAAADAREAIVEKAAQAFRPLVYTAAAALVVSGLYNILSHPGHTLRYHILFGVKLLLVAHVFTVSLAIVRPHKTGRARLMSTTAISGLIIIAISAYLRLTF